MMRSRLVSLLLTPLLLAAACTVQAATIQLPKTGQNGCFDAVGGVICTGTGQDFDKQKGVDWPVPRFIRNRNGTVTDDLTGLIWLQDANCTDTTGGISKASGPLIWSDALTWSNNLGSGVCGLTDGSVAGDWRLPNVTELESLVDIHLMQPATAGPFFNVNNNVIAFSDIRYWTSSSAGHAGQIAWTVSLVDGYVVYLTNAYSNDKASLQYVWPVRGGQFGDSVVSVHPASLDFGTVAAGGSAGQSVTIGNGGTTSRMQVNAMVLSGADVGQFSLSTGDGTGGTCGSTTPIIPPGANCTVTVNFNPSGGGAKTANLRVSTSDVTTPNTDIPLGGSALVNGACGTANGSSFNTPPATNLCASGTASALTGTGPWNWDCAGAGGGTNASCSANIRSYALTFTSGANGTLTGTTSQAINYGGTATTVTATPDPNYHFVNWTEKGIVVGTSPALTVSNVTAPHTYTANFAIDTFAVHFVSGGNGTLAGSTSQAVNYSADAATVGAIPDRGYYFVNWTEGGTVVGTGAALTVTNVTAPHTYTANFAIYTYTVTFASAGNGTLTGSLSQTVNYGDNATTVTAAPTANYHFVNWTEGGTPVSGIPALNVSYVTASHNYIANFAINGTYDVTFTAGGNGTISGNSHQTITYGTDAATVTAVPAAGYHFVNWTEGTIQISASPALTITNVTAPHSYTAHFAPDPTCGTANGGNFIVAPTSNLCAVGAASPLAGTGPWTWSCSANGTSASCSAGIQSFIVTPSAGAGSSMAPSTPQTVRYGSTTQFTIAPVVGYGMLATGCGGTLNGSTYTTGTITTDCTVSVSAVARNAHGTGSTQPSIADALRALNSLTGRVVLTAEERIRYDVAPLGSNGIPVGNGVVDIADVLLILRRTIGLGNW